MSNDHIGEIEIPDELRAQTVRGFVKMLKVEKGYGFIAAESGPDFFFHCSGLVDGLEFDERLNQMRVEFETAEGRQGPKAVNVRPIES
jgi:CspA family cold shock protein